MEADIEEPESSTIVDSDRRDLAEDPLARAVAAAASASLYSASGMPHRCLDFVRV
ncbi:hypothetical protein Pmar_PMAR010000, partial [Perkinsus marinus ATCC 50983]